MGIKGLVKLISEVAGEEAIKFRKFSEFIKKTKTDDGKEKMTEMTVSVDASLMIHKTVIAMRSSGKDMTNKEGQLTSHINGILHKCLNFLGNMIVPIFVFDGKAPKIKSKSLAKRKARKDFAEEFLKNPDLSEEKRTRYFKQTFRPSKEDIDEAKILLDLMGIPYIVAPGEADVVCAWLTTRPHQGKSYACGVCSDDSDMLALGAPYLFRDMLRFMNKRKMVQVISLKRTLNKMKLSMDQFVDLCVLLGNDNCDNIKGIGPKRAYHLILTHGDLESVFEALNDNKNSDDSSCNSSCSSDSDPSEENTVQECMLRARDYFKNALSEIDNSKTFVLTDDQLKLRKCQYEELIDFLCTKHNFDLRRVLKDTERLKQCQELMNVNRENTKKVHTIIQIRSSDYVMRSPTDNIECLPSSDEEENGKKEIRPTKKTSCPSQHKRRY